MESAISLAAGCFVPLALAGCGHRPDQVETDLDIPVAWRATPASATTAWPAEDWGTGFGSAELNLLIGQRRAENVDIAAPSARVRQADAQVRIPGAALLPILNGPASANWQHFGLGTGSSGS